ncbi:MAG TPA: alpha/beta hydrolase [Gemmataceae bacterium]|nr:alpha/beta hydrolase [Gemmataceae bacterium]
MPPPPDLNIQDVELTGAGGSRLHAWWMTPPDWEPGQGALLYCHGNAGNLSHRGEGLRRWRDLVQLAVLIFDYPGYGHSSGVPTEAGCYAAADTAFDWLNRVQKVPGERVLLYGGSLGGAVATDLAVRRPHRGLVLVSTFTSVADMANLRFPWLPARWLLRNRFDNLGKIAACHQPVFLAHGTADTVVPYTMGERLFAAANEPKHFFSMPGHDHNHTPPPDFYRSLRDFLAQVETTSPPPAAAGI